MDELIEKRQQLYWVSNKTAHCIFYKINLKLFSKYLMSSIRALPFCPQEVFALHSIQ